jgi:hypothetical protein
VNAFSVVVYFDVVEQGQTCIVFGFELCLMHEFSFEGVEEAFHGGIVPEIAFAAHRLTHAKRMQIGNILTRRILAASMSSVRM